MPFLGGVADQVEDLVRDAVQGRNDLRRPVLLAEELLESLPGEGVDARLAREQLRLVLFDQRHAEVHRDGDLSVHASQERRELPIG